MSGCSKRRRDFLGQTMTIAGAGWVCSAARLGAATQRPGEPSGKVDAPRPDQAKGGPSDSMLGYCGLYCGGCQAFQETKAGVRLSAEGDAPACEGCASSVVAPWCRECAIKACARGKSLRFCLPCDEYPCAKFTAFVNNPKYPYHKSVHRDMVRLKEVGIETWLREQAVRWLCPTCGSKFHWFARKCPGCGRRVNAEYWPD